MNAIRLAVSFFCLLAIIITNNVQAERYVVSMKGKEAYLQAYGGMRIPLSMMSVGNKVRNFELMGVSAKEVHGLKHLDMFVVDSDEGIELLMASLPGVLSIQEDVLFQGIDPSWKVSDSDTDIPPPVGAAQKAPALGELTWGQKALDLEDAWTQTMGEGAKVLVMDTGVDKDHPEIRSSFHLGKSFFNSFEEPPLYEYFDENGHGTHTAGTVVGDLVGVAPKAMLWVAQVCGASGACSPAGMLQAINWAIEEKVDVVNISIGGAYGSDLVSQAYEKARENGILVVAASGNNGKNRIDYPAQFTSVIAVGAIDESFKRAEFSQYGNDLDLVAPGDNVKSSFPGESVTITLKVDAGEGLSDEISNILAIGSNPSESILEADLIHVGLGKEEEVTDDVMGRIALVSRGELTFADKVKNISGKGAIGVIIYNNEPGLVTPLVSETEKIDLPIIMVDQETGVSLQEKLSQGNTLRASMEGNLGPSYISLSGTSMATPHVAGVLVLMRSAFPEITRDAAKEILLNTSVSLLPGGEKATPLEYGAGIVNAKNAVEEVLKAKASQTELFQKAN